MNSNLADFAQQVNFTRYANQKQGHYESFFQRANHPSRPLAFWIRYTIFSPKDRPQDAVGELWAVYFDGETNQHTAVKHELPLHQCKFSSSEFSVQLGDARLQSGNLSGLAKMGENSIGWDLAYYSSEKPLFLLANHYYKTKLPSAKSLVGSPLASYTGVLVINGEKIEVKNWIGSQNHNWGSKHTDLYAWGQVAGFDSHPASFLEVATARLKIGPIWSPSLTLLVLRHEGEEFALNSLAQARRAKGHFNYFNWDFSSETKNLAIKGTISAAPGAFVGLYYANPPGGGKHCLNTKLASCKLRLGNRQTNSEVILSTENRAAFEILTDDRQHGVHLQV